MSYKIVDTTLAAAVANAATVNVSYPTGTDAGTFTGAVGHKLLLGNSKMLYAPADFTLSFGTSNITITNAYGSTWASGERVYLELQTVGDTGIAGVKRTIPATLAYVNLGAPDTADADGVCASQAGTGALVINGALASGGVATFDVPRNVVAAWTGTAVLTVTGTDEYGEEVVESSASGTSMAGKKAFKTITGVSSSAAVTGATVGTGDVLGLPFFLQEEAMVLKEVQDDAAATAGTLVAGVTTEPSATTGDVRGTYDPNAACDGAKSFRLVIVAPDPTYKGLEQYAG
jgi:hypothetical protein